MLKSKRNIKSKLFKYQRLAKPINGLLGDYSKTVNVPGRPNYVFVRLSNNEVIEVFNSRTPATPDLPVLIGYDPKEPHILQVLSVRAGMNYSHGDTPLPLLSHHARTHEWFADDGGGTDVVFSQLRQFMPLRPSVSGLSVNFYRGVGWLNDGWQNFSGSSIDLTACVPATGARYVLLYHQAETLLPAVQTGIVKDLSTLAIEDIPKPPYRGYPIAAARLYAGQTQLWEARTRTDLVDLRFPLAHSFINLTDTPTSYSGSAKKAIIVNDSETGLEFGVASGGGSGAYIYDRYDPDAPPASPNSLDDEFNDGDPTGTVWKEFDPPGILTFSEANSFLNLQRSSYGIGVVGLYRDLPTGTTQYTLVTKIGVVGQRKSDVNAGIALFENAEDVNGDIRTFGIRYQNTAAASLGSVEVVHWNAYNSYNSSPFNPDHLTAPTEAYFRIRRNGSMYFYDYSKDGLGWEMLFTGTLAFDPKHVGLVVNTSSAIGPMGAYFDFFRYKPTDVGLFNLLEGQLVSQGGGGLAGYISVFQEGAFLATGVSMDYSNEFDVSATGTSIFIAIGVTSEERLLWLKW